MKLLFLMNSFKGTISAVCMNNVLKSKFNNVETLSVPFSDGGDNLLDTLDALFNYHIIKKEIITSHPCNKNDLVNSCYIINKNECFIESASFIGYRLLSKPNVYKSSSYPLGEAILDCLNLKETKHIFIGLGGSSTNDMGAGMLKALGGSFLDKNKNELFPCGGNIKDIYSLEFSNFNKKIYDIDFTILSDVKNPLLGKNGATYVYAKQKGAKEEDLLLLEKGMNNLANLYETYSNKKVKDIEGSGAAGGLGMAFLTFFNSKIISGADYILNSKFLNENLKSSTCVFTGEGRIDMSSFYGKGSIEIIKKAKEINPNIKIILLCGSIQKEAKEKITREFSNVLIIPMLDNALLYKKSIQKQVALDIFKKTIDLNFSKIKEMIE